MTDWSARFFACHEQRIPYPNPSAEEALTVEQAYRIQTEYNARRAEPVAGYKAALTATAAQAAMAIDQAIVGVLFDSGDFSTATHIPLSQPLLLETELGFHCSRNLSSPTTPADVFEAFDAISPCIELASPNLAGKPTGVDLIATNSASFGFIAGPPVPINPSRVDLITTGLAMQDQVLFAGTASEVMGGQANALSWLVNQVLGLGYPIAPGALFLTGSIGGMAPAKTGEYTASFSDLADIKFHLEEGQGSSA